MNAVQPIFWILILSVSAAMATTLDDLDAFVEKSESLRVLMEDRSEWKRYEELVLGYLGKDNLNCLKMRETLKPVSELSQSIPRFGERLWRAGSKEFHQYRGKDGAQFRFRKVTRPLNALWMYSLRNECQFAACDERDSLLVERWTSALIGSHTYVLERDGKYTGSSVALVPAEMHKKRYLMVVPMELKNVVGSKTQSGEPLILSFVADLAAKFGGKNTLALVAATSSTGKGYSAYQILPSGKVGPVLPSLEEFSLTDPAAKTIAARVPRTCQGQVAGNGSGKAAPKKGGTTLSDSSNTPTGPIFFGSGSAKTVDGNPSSNAGTASNGKTGAVNPVPGTSPFDPSQKSDGSNSPSGGGNGIALNPTQPRIPDVKVVNNISQSQTQTGSGNSGSGYRGVDSARGSGGGYAGSLPGHVGSGSGNSGGSPSLGGGSGGSGFPMGGLGAGGAGGGPLAKNGDGNGSSDSGSSGVSGRDKEILDGLREIRDNTEAKFPQDPKTARGILNEGFKSKDNEVRAAAMETQAKKYFEGASPEQEYRELFLSAKEPKSKMDPEEVAKALMDDMCHHCKGCEYCEGHHEHKHEKKKKASFFLLEMLIAQAQANSDRHALPEDSQLAPPRTPKREEIDTSKSQYYTLKQFTSCKPDREQPPQRKGEDFLKYVWAFDDDDENSPIKVFAPGKSDNKYAKCRLIKVASDGETVVGLVREWFTDKNGHLSITQISGADLGEKGKKRLLNFCVWVKGVIPCPCGMQPPLAPLANLGMTVVKPKMGPSKEMLLNNQQASANTEVPVDRGDAWLQ